MSRRGKKVSLDIDLVQSISDEDHNKVFDIIKKLIKPDQFLSALGVLDSQDKDRPETIEYLEVLVNQFCCNSEYICDSFKDPKEWHDWTEVVEFISNILWKNRNKFEKNFWIKATQTINEVSFKNFIMFDEVDKCKCCSGLLSTILDNFIKYKEAGEKPETFYINPSKIRQFYSRIGEEPNFITGIDIIEEAFANKNIISNLMALVKSYLWGCCKAIICWYK